ncbi:MAG: ABC transporter ATP-binding protein [Chloroflexi bacterium]|nr:ABC transporter ATP-binding protein [Chloroflexota bacterium]
MSAGTLRLERVTKVFQTPEGRDVVAVDDVTLELPPGSFVTLLGPSGCGKTTTLRMIAGFETPTRGRILLDERDIARLTPDKRGMGMVFQSYALFPHLSVFENVAYGVRLRGVRGRDLDQRVEAALALVNLHGLARRRPSELSGGQQQRVALARAMAIEPRVLLFDEPLSNLDAKLRVSLRSEIRRIQQQLGTTSVYVTHDQSEAMALSDIVVVMNAGRVEQAGSPSEVYRRPRSRFVADFIGSADFLDGPVLGVTPEGLDVSLFGVTVRVAAGDGHRVGDAATVVVRPESVRVGDGPIRALVRGSTFLGSLVEYELMVGDQVFGALDPDWMSRGLHVPGEEVPVSLIGSKLYALPPDVRSDTAAHASDTTEVAAD